MPLSLRLVARKRIGGMLALLLGLVVHCKGDLRLIHETGGGHGNPWVGWSYSLLPSSFPLTWDEAREACEVIPGSMLARVEEWEGEAALAEYLKAISQKGPMWLANRQTLPEVLQDEQREMHHLSKHKEDPNSDMDASDPGTINLGGGDLTVGGDVGVTLRCSIYILGVGIVHELCSSRSVSAALCVQRLSTERPLSDICPSSFHHTWLLVNRRADTSSPTDVDSSLTVTGLQQCHHRQLGQIFCHLKNGWSKVVCPPADGPTQLLKHHSGKNHHKYHHANGGRGHLRQSHRGTFSSKEGGLYSNNHEAFTAEAQEYVKMLTEKNNRSKRNTHLSLSETIKKQRERDMLRLAPTEIRFLTKGEGLNLDAIESIMQQDFAKPKKRKNKNRNKNKKRKNNRNKGQPQNTTIENEEMREMNNSDTETAQQVPVLDEFFEIPTTVSYRLGNDSNGNKEAISDEDMVLNTTPTKSFQDTTASAANQVTDNPSINGGTDKNQNAENEQEESGPSMQDNAGPAEDSPPETVLIEAAVAEEPMDESNVAEVSSDVIKGRPPPEVVDDSLIVFPEIPESPSPDRTPRIIPESQSGSVSANQFMDENNPRPQNVDEDVVSETASLVSTATPEKPDFNPILFPRNVHSTEGIPTTAIEPSNNATKGSRDETPIKTTSNEQEFEETDNDEFESTMNDEVTNNEEIQASENIVDDNDIDEIENTEILSKEEDAENLEGSPVNKNQGENVEEQDTKEEIQDEEDTKVTDEGKENLLIQIYKGLFG